MASRIVHGLATGVHATSSRRRPTPRHHAVWLLACAGMLMGAATDARSRPCGSSAPPLPKKSVRAHNQLLGVT
ncbi:hypothetical protein H257_11894 [Aphanomyces astaci]|uniref:Uncharacterized protein n=1 Tax=Aphanomyces astaci TaxID=112090 RepID=W4G2W6_APHAT|nr:hypothetical protein H257_11894 [Aphanomyces astaci]ETV73399.1 hypothetical protein H257_11894 [Aphanomyces astaci]|eukprot:XP_009837274.1 hypothetical protein H257_11894 [Aphanomyces astaci]